MRHVPSLMRRIPRFGDGVRFVVLLGAALSAIGARAARAQDPGASAIGSQAPDTDDDNDRPVGLDEPGQDDRLNRELWVFARGTSYEATMRRVRGAQRRRVAAASAPEMTLPNGWRLAPAGVQVEVGRLPYDALVFHGRLVVLNAGFYPGGYAGQPGVREDPVVSVVDIGRAFVTDSIEVAGLYPSAATVGPDRLFVSGGSAQVVYQIDTSFQVIGTLRLGAYAGPIAAVDGGRLAVTSMTAAAPDPTDSTRQRLRPVAAALAIVEAATGRLAASAPLGHYPSAVRTTAGKIYVALLGEDAVAVYDTALHPLRTVRVGRAPQALCADSTRLYVVNSGSDEVTVIGTAQDSVVATIPLRATSARFGSAPTSCTTVGDRLYVSQAGENAVAVLKLPEGTVIGRIPTGWYPTRVLADDGYLFVTNAKGIRARRPNPRGPQPDPSARPSGPDYVLRLLRGSVSVVPRVELDTKLDEWTARVDSGAPLFSSASGIRLPIRHVFYVIRENRTYDQVLGDLGRGDGDSSLTLFGERVTPAAHKLARDFVTLDQFFVDGEISVLGHSFTTSGYASPFLEWLGNAAYAGRYNGYPFGTVPGLFSPAYLWDALEAKGLSYRVYGEPYYVATRAYRAVTDAFGRESPEAQRFYTRSLELAAAGDRGRGFVALLAPYARPGMVKHDMLQLLDSTSLVDALSVYFFGDSTLRSALRTSPFKQSFASFLAHYAFGYPTWCLDFSDLQRVIEWKRDFTALAKRGEVPQLSYIWLPNDHTQGVTRGMVHTPFAFVAQNDAALSRLVETISRSGVWGSSLILVEEDDAQNGPDHVDATRTVALAAGPYVRRRVVIHERYDQLSVLRTIGLILGFDPLGMNDALAAPMLTVFQRTPRRDTWTGPPSSKHLDPTDLSLYTALRPERRAEAPAPAKAACP